MNILGIDLSLTSPALCLFKGDKFCFKKCQFFFLSSTDKYLYIHKRLHGETFPEYECDSERYNNIASWVVDVCKSHDVDKAFVEGYSFGSTGRVFQIAENCGVLKHMLWAKMIDYDVVPPTVVKKLATGKGNANKELMEQAFIKETGFDVRDILHMTQKQWNPSSDIIDSYYICKYGVEHERQNAGVVEEQHCESDVYQGRRDAEGNESNVA